jgi:outer membrane protein OmpA-like peptidoglycan-associated protein
MLALALALLASLTIASVPSTSEAQASLPPMYRFDPFVQKPATSPLGLFTLEGAAAGDKFEWVGLRADYAHGLLALVDQNGKTIGQVIPDRLDAHVLASFGFRKWFELGLDLPVTLYQKDGFDVVRNLYPASVPRSAVYTLFPKVASTGLDDIRIVPKFALPFHKPFTLALVPEIRLRTGDSTNFMGDSRGPFFGHAGPIFAPRAEGEGTLWRLRVVGELGYVSRGPEQFYNVHVGDQITFGAGVTFGLPQLPAAPQLNSWEVIGEFNGNTNLTKPFTFKQGNDYATPMELVGGVRARFVHGVMVFAGFGSGLSGGGYGREVFRAFAGVGWEPPNVVSTVPTPTPTPVEEDRDHDGVPDKEDRCPDQPGSPETDGCPDKDGDGIPDIDDKCPDEPGPAENQGCPVEGPVVVYKPPKLELRAGITFETGKADIKSESFGILDEVAAFLMAHTDLKKVRIEGHTDNRGSAKYNLDLSKRRARSVLLYLVKKGVAEHRLSSEGYGFERPIADNATALGRARNRRVDFTVTDPLPESGENPIKGNTGDSKPSEKSSSGSTTTFSAPAEKTPEEAPEKATPEKSPTEKSPPDKTTPTPAPTPAPTTPTPTPAPAPTSPTGPTGSTGNAPAPTTSSGH